MKVNVHHAKTNLSGLILRAEAGEEIVIARAGKPVVRLVPVDAVPRKRYKPGALKGRIQVSADFLEPDEAFDKEIERLFDAGPVFPAQAKNQKRHGRKPRKA